MTWDCSSEFDASSDQEITLLHSNSYVSLPSSLSKQGSSVKLAFKTLTRQGVLLYSSGPPARADFVAVELVEGHVRLALDTGNGVVDVFSQSAVNDGQWHQLDIQFSAASLSLTVDGSAVNGGVASGGGGSKGMKYVELSGNVFLGGIESGRQARAEKQGVRSSNSSVQGCVRRLQVDGRPLGLAEARVTRRVSAGCGWRFACAETRPCVESATCSQRGTDSFQCDCLQPPCTRPQFIGTVSSAATKTTADYRSTNLSAAAAATTPATAPPAAANSSSSDSLADLLHLSPVQVIAL